MPEDRGHQLILFDIDGTLIYTGGAGGKAMSRAFTEVCRVADGFEGIQFPGRTDPLILADALARLQAAPGPDLTGQIQEAYFRCLPDELRRVPESGSVLPGVVALLTSLSTRPDTTVALLTGNYSQAAEMKLRHYGLWQWFSSGAFGEDAADRPGLVEVAVARARSLGMPPVEPGDVVVIGDTPLDVACGRANGARTIAVATGNVSLEALAAAGADAVWPDLAGTSDVMALLDRWRRG